MANERAAPFKAGDPQTKEWARLGGIVAAEQRRAKQNANPRTQGLLGKLLTLTTDQWMDRFDLTGPSWVPWRIVGKVLDGLPLNDAERITYQTLTGRATAPSELREVWAVCGRGSGKTTFLTVQAIKAACRGYPVRGIPRVLLLAFVRDQAGVAFEFAQEFIDGDRELRKLVARRTREALTFAHGVQIETISSNFRSVRGYSVATALCDEIALWWNDAADANPAQEVVRALRPGLGKVPGSRLLAATSPWTEEGLVYETVQRHHGNEESKHVLAIRAPTMTLNPSFDAARIAADEQEDPESAASEYGAQWRVAGGSLVNPAAYDACVDAGIVERSPCASTLYVAAADLSGGTGQDSAALSICHVEQEDGGPEVCVQDVVKEWAPPFDPGTMVAEMAAHCRRFGITEVTGDQFSEGFAAAEFARHRIAFAACERKTTEVLIDSLAVINTRRVRLLDDPKLRKQYLNLRRDYRSGGRPGVAETRARDDLAVVTARGITVGLGLGIEEEPPVIIQFR